MSVQLENGFIRIANEIWDEVIRRDFTKRQKDILLFVWRLSYGCNRKTAHIPMLKDFELCGVTQNHIKEELNYLNSMKVLEWDQEGMIFSFNKDYSFWQASPVRKWNDERFKGLIHINLSTSQNRKSNEEGLPKTGSEDFPKQEVSEPERPRGTKDEGMSKDSIKDIKDIIYSLFEEWNSLDIVNHRKLTPQIQMQLRMKLGTYSPDELIHAMEEYAHILKSDDYVLTTKWGLEDFLSKSHYEKFLLGREPRVNYLKKQNAFGSRGNYKTEQEIPKVVDYSDIVVRDYYTELKEKEKRFAAAIAMTEG